MAIILPQRDISTGKAMYDVDSGLMIATGAEPAVYDCGVFAPGQMPSAWIATIKNMSDDPSCYVLWPDTTADTSFHVMGLGTTLSLNRPWTIPFVNDGSGRCRWRLVHACPGEAVATYYPAYYSDIHGDYIFNHSCSSNWPSVHVYYSTDLVFTVTVVAVYPSRVRVNVEATLSFRQLVPYIAYKYWRFASTAIVTKAWGTVQPSDLELPYSNEHQCFTGCLGYHDGHLAKQYGATSAIKLEAVI